MERQRERGEELKQKNTFCECRLIDWYARINKEIFQARGADWVDGKRSKNQDEDEDEEKKGKTIRI